MSRLEGMRVRVSGVEYESEKGISEVAVDDDCLPKINMPARESLRKSKGEREGEDGAGRQGGERWREGDVLEVSRERQGRG